MSFFVLNDFEIQKLYVRKLDDNPKILMNRSYENCVTFEISESKR